MSDHALNALLAEYVAPPVPAGLAARVAAAALALPQAPRPVRAPPRHDRRAAWLRRPLLLGGVALGLAVSGALAATLAGARLDRLPIVEAVLAKFVNRERPPAAAPPPEPALPPAEPAPVQERPTPAPKEAPPPPPPRAVPSRDEAPPIVLPEPAPPPPPPPDAAAARPIELPPAMPLPPRPIATEARPVAIPAPERVAEPRPGGDARLQQERIDRAERLRAARQAQIERLQRVQQRRERIRRLRRD